MQFLRNPLTVSTFLAFTLLNPSLAGLARAESQQRFDEILACHTKENEPGMAVIISQGGKLRYRNARGLANAELGVPLRPDNVFHIGSVTKQFTAAAILLLQEQEKLNLDDDIRQYVAAWPATEQPVTLRQLLSHTSGLSDYVEDQEIFTQKVQEQTSLDEMLTLFADQASVGAPGEQFKYSNTGYILLGKVIEVVSGQSYGEFLRQQIFQPLGMENTRLADREFLANRADGYTHSATGMINADRTPAFRRAMPIEMIWTHAARHDCLNAR